MWLQQLWNFCIGHLSVIKKHLQPAGRMSNVILLVHTFHIFIDYGEDYSLRVCRFKWLMKHETNVFQIQFKTICYFLPLHVLKSELCYIVDCWMCSMKYSGRASTSDNTAGHSRILCPLFLFSRLRVCLQFRELPLLSAGSHSGSFSHPSPVYSRTKNTDVSLRLYDNNKREASTWLLRETLNEYADNKIQCWMCNVKYI